MLYLNNQILMAGRISAPSSKLRCCPSATSKPDHLDVLEGEGDPRVVTQLARVPTLANRGGGDNRLQTNGELANKFADVNVNSGITDKYYTKRISDNVLRYRELDVDTGSALIAASPHLLPNARKLRRRRESRISCEEVSEDAGLLASDGRRWGTGV